MEGHEKNILVKNDEWMFTLQVTENGEYIFETACGGIGMGEVRVRLTTEGIKRYEAKGEVFLRNLSHALCKESKHFFAGLYEKVRT